MKRRREVLTTRPRGRGRADGRRATASRASRPAIRSGRVASTALTAATVITASPTPISAWTPSIAGSTVPSGTVPEIASSSAVAAAPAITASHAPPATTARKRRSRPRQQAPRTATHQRSRPPSAPITPMLRTFAPSARDAAVGEHERLRREHDRHHQAGEPRPEQDRRQRGAEEVAARAAGDGEVEHLRGEDERRRDAEQRDARARRASRSARRSATATAPTATTPAAAATPGSRKPSGMCIAAPRRLAARATRSQMRPRRDCVLDANGRRAPVQRERLTGPSGAPPGLAWRPLSPRRGRGAGNPRVSPAMDD